MWLGFTYFIWQLYHGLYHRFFCLILCLYFINEFFFQISEDTSLFLHDRERYSNGLNIYAHRWCQLAPGFCCSLKWLLHFVRRPNKVVSLVFFLDLVTKGSFNLSDLPVFSGLKAKMELWGLSTVWRLSKNVSFLFV